MHLVATMLQLAAAAASTGSALSPSSTSFVPVFVEGEAGMPNASYEART